MPRVSRDAEAAGRTGRALGDDRRRRAQVPGRRGRAAEVRVRVRRRRRDGARPGPRRRRRPLLAALRDQGRLRQVRRAPTPRAPGALDGAPRPQRHVADAVGSVLGGDGPARRRRTTRSSRCFEPAPSIGVDQTGWPDLEDSSLPPWQMWCVTAPGLVYHRICDDKSTRTFVDLPGRLPGLGRRRRVGNASGGRPRVQRI